MDERSCVRCGTGYSPSETLAANEAYGERPYYYKAASGDFCLACWLGVGPKDSDDEAPPTSAERAALKKAGSAIDRIKNEADLARWPAVQPEGDDQFVEGFKGFVEQFSAQAKATAAPTNERSIVLSLALGLQGSLGLEPGSVIFEKRVDPVRPGLQPGRRIDLWFPTLRRVIEVKYAREMTAGGRTSAFGGLLADFNKVAYDSTPWKYVLFVTDRHMRTYLQNKDFLPDMDPYRTIEREEILDLPATARIAAESDGPWIPMTVNYDWGTSWEDWTFYLWMVHPHSPEASGRGEKIA